MKTSNDSPMRSRPLTPMLRREKLLVTSMDKDGHQTGYDLPLLRSISDVVEVPIIASGGAGKPEHLYDALTEGGADAVLAASIFPISSPADATGCVPHFEANSAARVGSVSTIPTSSTSGSSE